MMWQCRRSTGQAVPADTLAVDPEVPAGLVGRLPVVRVGKAVLAVREVPRAEVLVVPVDTAAGVLPLPHLRLNR